MVERITLNQAREMLGVADRVELAIVTFQHPDDGCFRGWRDGAWRISIDRRLSVTEASRTLWHELGHVCQAERAGSMANLVLIKRQELLDARLIGPHQRRFFRDRAYNRLPTEREAEDLAWDCHDELPLAVRR